MHLISAMFDSQRVIDDYMDLQQWRTCYRSLYRVTSLLRDSKGLVLGENQHEKPKQSICDVIKNSEIIRHPHVLSPAGVISNEDSTDVTLASQLNKDFLKKRDNDDDNEVTLTLSSHTHLLLPLQSCRSSSLILNCDCRRKWLTTKPVLSRSWAV
jgi:hypothetical protein